jgi:hypothetical protein
MSRPTIEFRCQCIVWEFHSLEAFILFMTAHRGGRGAEEAKITPCPLHHRITRRRNTDRLPHPTSAQLSALRLLDVKLRMDHRDFV